MATLVSIREFARQIGVSHTAVRKAIDTGRIKVDNSIGKPRINLEEGIIQWQESTDASKQRKPIAPPDSPAALDPVSPHPPIPDPPPEMPPDPAPAAGEDLEDPIFPEQEEGRKKTAKKHAESFAAARAKREQAEARLSELELEKKLGILIPADQVERVWSDMVGAFRARILSLPTKAALAVAGMETPAEIEATLRAMVNEALNELSEYDPERADQQTGAEGGGDPEAPPNADGQPVG